MSGFPHTAPHCSEIRHFGASRHNIGNASEQVTVLPPPVFLILVFCSFFDFLAFHRRRSVVAAAYHIIQWYLSVALSWSRTLHFLCRSLVPILHLIKVQTNADIWFQLSSLRSIIGTISHHITIFNTNSTYLY